MTYQSLRPPDTEFDEESDGGSIQHSPKLDTGSQFSFSGPLHDSSYYSDGHALEDTPFQPEHDSFQEGLPQQSPYHDSPGQVYQEPASVYPYGEHDTGAINGDSSKEQSRSAEYSAHPSANHYYGYEQSPYADQSYASQSYDSPTPDAPIYAARNETSERTTPQKSIWLSRSVGSSPGNGSPASASKQSPNRTTGTHKPSDLSPVLESAPNQPSQLNRASLTQHQPLKFDDREHRRKSYSGRPPSPHGNGTTAASLARSPSVATEDDDALPFESTTKMAAQRRPQSVVGLARATGPVMSSQTFENYRKSISSLQMLQKAAKSSHAQKKAGSGPDNEGSDVDEEEEDDASSATSELPDGDHPSDDDLDNSKEQRRKSARMRQEQDARMSIYRQKMMKIVGNPSPTRLDKRNTMYEESFDDLGHANSSSGSVNDDNEIMDDIPISILQAHGFPKSRSYNSVTGIRNSTSTIMSVENAEGPEQSKKRPSSTLGPSSLGRPISMASSRMLNQQATPIGLASPLPPIFGNKNNLTSRGLVGEITREEEMRQRRKTFGYTNVPSPTTHQNPELLEMQTKLDHVIELLSTMSPSLGAQITPQSMYAPSVNNLSIRGPATNETSSVRRESMASWREMPSHAYQRAQSIRSMQSPAASFTVGIPPHMSPQYPPGQFAMNNPSEWNPTMGPPTMPPVPPQHLVRGAQPQQKASNRPSQMRLVQPDDDDEDEDEAWKQILEKRRLLKDQWINQEVSST